MEVLLGKFDAIKRCNFKFTCTACDYYDSTLRFEDGSQFKSDQVYVCDGAFSKLRSALLKRHPGIITQEHYAHQYREILIPPLKSGNYALDPNWLHIWPRKDFMLIALPNRVSYWVTRIFTAFRMVPLQLLSFTKTTARIYYNSFMNTFLPCLAPRIHCLLIRTCAHN